MGKTSKVDFHILKSITINKELVIQKSDRDNTVVLISKDYTSKMELIFADTHQLKKSKLVE